MRRRELLWTCFGLAAVLALLLAEGGYRYLVRCRVSDLADEVLARHPHWDRLRPEFRRFGREATLPEPSLFRDFRAWSTRKLGRSSELDYNENPFYSSHAYLFVGFESEREADKEVHSFLWSPRRRRFVPNELHTGCSTPGCPWTDSQN